jgi:hypothetical protein
LPGLVPDIRVLGHGSLKDEDGRDKRGHDGENSDLLALSKIERQHRRFRSRAADHDLAVFCFFLIAQESVAMIRDSIDHFRFAGAANAFGAGERNVDAGVEQHVQNGVARRHRDGAPATMQPNVKATLRTGNRTFCHCGCPVAECALKRIAEIGAEFRGHVRSTEVDP